MWDRIPNTLVLPGGDVCLIFALRALFARREERKTLGKKGGAAKVAYFSELHVFGSCLKAKRVSLNEPLPAKIIVYTRIEKRVRRKIYKPKILHSLLFGPHFDSLTLYYRALPYHKTPFDTLQFSFFISLSHTFTISRC